MTTTLALPWRVVHYCMHTPCLSTAHRAQYFPVEIKIKNSGHQQQELVDINNNITVGAIMEFQQPVRPRFTGWRPAASWSIWFNIVNCFPVIMYDQLAPVPELYCNRSTPFTMEAKSSLKLAESWSRLLKACRRAATSRLSLPYRSSSMVIVSPRIEISSSVVVSKFSSSSSSSSSSSTWFSLGPRAKDCAISSWMYCGRATNLVQASRGHLYLQKISAFSQYLERLFLTGKSEGNKP